MNEIQYESLQETAAMADAVNEVEQALRALHEGRNKVAIETVAAA